MSEDPDLSEGTRRKLRAELREIRGSEGTSDEIPAPPPVKRAGGFAERWTIVAATLLLAIAVGGAISLALDSWWFLVLALGLHALGTLGVFGLAAGLLSESEHASPELAQDLEADGVSAPDRLLTDLADEQDRGEDR